MAAGTSKKSGKGRSSAQPKGASRPVKRPERSRQRTAAKAGKGGGARSAKPKRGKTTAPQRASAAKRAGARTAPQARGRAAATKPAPRRAAASSRKTSPKASARPSTKTITKQQRRNAAATKHARELTRQGRERAAALKEREKLKAAKERERAAALKEREKLKAAKERERLKAAKERERAAALKERERAAAAKEAQRQKALRERERERAAAAREAQRQKALRERERAAAAREAQRQKALKERERVAAAREAQRQKALKEREKLKAAKEREKLKAAKAVELARRAKERAAQLERTRQLREAEKERLRLAREAEKERLRLEKEAEKERLRLEKEAEKERERLARETERLAREAEREAYRKAKEAERERLRAEREAARKLREGKVAKESKRAARAGVGRTSGPLYTAAAIPNQAGTSRRVASISDSTSKFANLRSVEELAKAVVRGEIAPAEEPVAAAPPPPPPPERIDERYALILERLEKAGGEFQKEYRESFEMSWIYHDSALEGVVYTYPELKLAMDPSSPVVEDASLQPAVTEIRRHKQAIDYAYELADKKRVPLTVDAVKKLYLILRPEDGDLKNVKYRKDIPQHRLYFHEYAQPDKIAIKVRQVIDWINGPEPKKLKNPLRIAVRAHFDLLRVFPFSNDSGKVARLLMNVLLMRSGYPPAIIHAAERQRYYETLKGALPTLINMCQEAIQNGMLSIEKRLEEHETKLRPFGG